MDETISKEVPKRVMDLTGQMFGRLTIINFAGVNHKQHALWFCKCSCGKITKVLARSLRAGMTKSCGCGMSRKTHGMTKHPAFGIWGAMIQRTSDPNCDSWELYGGRGITVCDEWENSFEAFWADMGPTWRDGLSLDRIDNSRGYYKENCRWVTPTVQSHNRNKRKGCSSQYIGVSVLKRGISACIAKGEIKEHLGSFKSEIEAATAYDNRSEELYGDRPNGTICIMIKEK